MDWQTVSGKILGDEAEQVIVGYGGKDFEKRSRGRIILIPFDQLLFAIYGVDIG